MLPLDPGSLPGLPLPGVTPPTAGSQWSHQAQDERTGSPHPTASAEPQFLLSLHTEGRESPPIYPALLPRPVPEPRVCCFRRSSTEGLGACLQNRPLPESRLPASPLRAPLPTNARTAPLVRSASCLTSFSAHSPPVGLSCIPAGPFRSPSSYIRIRAADAAPLAAVLPTAPISRPHFCM